MTDPPPGSTVVATANEFTPASCAEVDVFKD